MSFDCFEYFGIYSLGHASRPADEDDSFVLEQVGCEELLILLHQVLYIHLMVRVGSTLGYSEFNLTRFLQLLPLLAKVVIHFSALNSEIPTD